MSDMTPEKATALRKPFPKESIGILPKPYKRDSVKAQCGECGGFHGMPAMHLDYVGHAATTDRLLTVDPEWTWDFALHRADGTPVLNDGDGNLWIKLTICGVTRLGVGDGKSAKERIGDAIRNAAMRFGVALDLWAKEDLVEFAQAAAAMQPAPPPPLAEDTGEQITPAQVKKLAILQREHGMETDEARYAWLSRGVQREITSSKQLTKAEATRAIDKLTEDGPR